LLATNRDERLRLRKNTAKIRRLVTKLQARSKDTAASDDSADGPVLDLLQALYSGLAATFKDIESGDEAALKCFSRLIIRCESCAARQMELADHLTQFDGLLFEYILARKAHGEDAAQTEKFETVDTLIALMKSTLRKRVQLDP
jgi:hypothetical protein